MRFSFAAAIALVLAPVVAHADPDNTEKHVGATRTHHAPKIDGILDDPAWAEATPDDRMLQFLPVEHAKPGQRTEIRIVYDDDAIYIGARLDDDHPNDIVAKLTRRDRDVETDYIQFWIDSRNDKTAAYSFRVSAANVQLDGLWFESGDVNVDWDAVWTSAVHRDEHGWSCELRIPLSVFRFPERDVQSWGFEAMRYISRDKEQDFWAMWPATLPGFVSRFGHVDGMTGLKPVRTFELRPFVVARVGADTDSGGAPFGLRGTNPQYHPAFDAGLDLKLGLTSDLTLDATINPDFGQVDADSVVLNLSRFETFFPEKRPFFLEGVELFANPFIYQPAMQLFYSRRIGRPPSGLGIADDLVLNGHDYTVTDAPRALRIYSAAKVTGKVSDHLQVGALEAVTGSETVTALDPTSGTNDTKDYQLAPPRNYALLRGRYDFGNSSYVGATATAVNRLDGDLHLAIANHDAYTQGLDAQWIVDPDYFRLTAQLAFSERSGGSTFQDVNGETCAGPTADQPGACFAISRADGTKMGPGAAGAGVNTQMQITDGRFLARASYYAYSPQLDLNDFGYLAQWDQQEIRGFAGWVEPHPQGPFRSWDSVLGGFTHLAFDGTPQDTILFVNFEGTLQNYYYFSGEFDYGPPVGSDIYETYDGARFPKVSFEQFSLRVNTDSRKAVVWQGSVRGSLAADGYDSEVAGEALDLNLLSQLELALLPDVGATRALRFYSCTTPENATCTPDDVLRHYRFAQLDSAFTSLTLRGTWTFSPTLTLQAYAQLFMDIGAYSKYRDLDIVATERRPLLPRGAMIPVAYNGDTDGDGVKDDDFQDATLNVNVVLRWEFRPGSTLIGVFTRNQNAAYTLGGESPHFRFTGLASGPTEDVLLLKLVYFLG